MNLAVKELYRFAGGEGEVHIVTRDMGRSMRRAAARLLRESGEGDIVTLDFSGVGIVDYSCADEFLAKLLTRLIAGEYGDRYLRLTNLTASQRENIDVALERKRLPSLLVHQDRSWECLGTIKPYLRETLDIVMAGDRVSARDLSSKLRIELNTSSTRLINLHRQRLVRRRERTIAEGGREFVYDGLLSAAAGSEGAGA